ncbi:MAG: PilZ domain-containing protein [Oleispira sp.]|nr:PilZ domain-containing protein [Oleispira sp.]
MSDQSLDSTQEHRRFRRINFVDAVQVVSEDVSGAEAASWEAQCIDISMLGMLLEVPKGFPLIVGTPFEVHLILAEDVLIEMPCTLVHVEGNHAGFRAEVMSIDCVTNLRRLLELNLADSAEVERELAELIKQTA